VIGVGSPEGAPGRGAISGGPRRRSGPSPHPHSRLLTIGRQRGDGSPETSGGGQGMATAGRGAKGGARWTVSPMTPGRRIASPFPPSVLRRFTIARRRGRMGAKQPQWPCLPRREQRGGFSRPFPPFRNYFRFCKSTSGLTPTSIRTLFPY